MHVLRCLLVLATFAVALLFGVVPREFAAAAPVVPAPAPSWSDTVDRVAPSVVSLEVRATRDFDTERARSSTGTGFVIDAERGLILTNRHMVHDGPVIAKAVFLNHEEVTLEPVYRDPVHDFGFYKFDPGAVRHMAVTALPLRPEKARVGMEIRVIGNDSGEKISILDGTLARLDRDAPDYGSNTYNDFDTFYFQAASNTSGGSSGSPVVDIEGHVVALNAGSRTTTASAFYLPLDRVVRAVPYVRRGETPPRGTLLANFKYTPYDELRRLGLSANSEAAARAFRPRGVGLLVVERVTPGGPGEGALEPGDVLISLEGAPVADFVTLEEVLDGRVGGAVNLRVERGGVARDVRLVVQDLHAVSPASFLEMGRSVLQPVSYQQARLHHVPVRGVYVAQSGFSLANAGVPERAVLVSFDGAPVTSLDQVEAELARRPDGARVRVRWRPIDDPRQERESVVSVDRRWYAARRCDRPPMRGTWVCRDLAPPAAAVPPAVALGDPAPWSGSKAARDAADALVWVEFDIPYPTAGVKDLAYQGVGVVVDQERGLILVDRDTVPVRLGQVTLTFRGQARVPGEVVWVHPVHNLAVVRYNPAAVTGTAPAAVEGTFSARDLRPGQRVTLVAMAADGRVLEHPTKVERVAPLVLGASRTPRFRDVNVEAAALADVPENAGGVVLDRRGRPLGLWISFHDARAGEATFHVLPGRYVQSTIEAARGGPAEPRALGFEVAPVDRAEARDRGWTPELAEPWADPAETTLFEVQRVWGGAPAASELANGDLLLEVDGEPLTRVTQLEIPRSEQATIRFLRAGEVMERVVRTQPLSGRGVDRVVQWAGLVAHEPHREVSSQSGVVKTGVYGAWIWYGTPGHDGGILPTRRIVEIDGGPITSLDDLLRVAASQRDGQAVRVKLEQLDGRVEVKTLELDTRFWPTLLLEDRGEGWTSRVIGESL